jgi:hypothetical protein
MMRAACLTLVAVMGTTTSALAQQSATACPPPRSLSFTADSIKPDIAIIARVQAAELRFNSQPSTSLQISGCPQVDTSKVVLRTNLPTPVQPGVTYRNVIVDFRLSMKFTDLECVLAGKPCSPADTTRIR